MTACAADRFERLLGAGRGTVTRPADHDMPAGPEGHPVCVGVDMRPWQGSTWWRVGWHGSDLTVNLHLDERASFMWTRHRRSGSMEPRVLVADARPAAGHVPWEDLPDEVKTLVRAALAAGLPARPNSTNERPLDRT